MSKMLQNVLSKTETDAGRSFANLIFGKDKVAEFEANAEALTEELEGELAYKSQEDSEGEVEDKAEDESGEDEETEDEEVEDKDAWIDISLYLTNDEFSNFAAKLGDVFDGVEKVLSAQASELAEIKAKLTTYEELSEKVEDISKSQDEQIADSLDLARWDNLLGKGIKASTEDETVITSEEKEAITEKAGIVESSSNDPYHPFLKSTGIAQ